LLAAIEAEQNRADPPARPAAPSQPQRQMQQVKRAGENSDIDPFLAELLGTVKERQQPAARPAQPPQRQERVQQTPGRVASDSGLAKVFGNTR